MESRASLIKCDFLFMFVNKCFIIKLLLYYYISNNVGSENYELENL